MYLNAEYHDFSMDPDMAYLIGFLHDGCITNFGKKRVVEFYQKDTNLLNEARQLLVKNFNYAPSIRPHKGASRFRVYKKEIVLELEKNFMTPKFEDWSSAKQYIAGFTDAEGCLIQGKRTRMVLTQADKLKLETISGLLKTHLEMSCNPTGPYGHKSSKKPMYYLVIDTRKRVEKFLSEIPVRSGKYKLRGPLNYNPLKVA